MSRRIVKEIELLTRRLRELDVAYFTHGKPLVSDAEYDAVRERLRVLRGDDVSASVGARPRGDPVSHSRAMLSLERARDESQLRRFHESVQSCARSLSLSDVLAYVLERKYDGLAAALRFDAFGRLAQVLTRGDGSAGDDVTDAALRFMDPASIQLNVARLPASLRGSPLEVRGEVLLPTRLAPVLSPRGSATARNVAAGLLMRRDFATGDDSARAVLQFRSFGLLLPGGVAPSEWTRYRDMSAALRDAGLRTCDLSQPIDDGNIDAVVRLWRHEAERLRRESEFDMDGLVLKVDSLALQAALGDRNRSPRWAVALKFDAEQGVTRVTDVRLQIGRFGTATPVAVVEPVTINGAELSRASLHHLGRAFAFGLFPFERSALVLLERGGDVIPHVVRRVDDVPLRAPLDVDCNEMIAPLAPVCPCAVRTPLVPHGPNQWRCAAKDCEPQRMARRLHLCRALQLDHMAERTLQQLIELGVVRCDADVLRLAALRDRLGLTPAAGWGERRWARLAAQVDMRVAARSLELRALAESSDEWRVSAVTPIENWTPTVPLWRAILAVGAEHVGPTVARGVAAHVKSFGAFVALFTSDADTTRTTALLLECENVGDVGAQALVQQMRSLLASVDGRDLLYTLQLMASDAAADAKHDPANDKVVRFAVTGTLKSMTRAQLSERLELHGATLLADVSSKAQFLIVADAARSNSTKLRKATELGLQLMTESQLENWFAEEKKKDDA
jgi:DNA ligase (NAD+)